MGAVLSGGASVCLRGSPPPHLSTEEYPADGGNVEGSMYLCSSASVAYSSMAHCSFRDNGLMRPHGGIVPGIRSMAQSYYLCGGSPMAFVLLTTSSKFFTSHTFWVCSLLPAFWGSQSWWILCAIHRYIPRGSEQT